MSQQEKVLLLAEGHSDKAFFEKLFASLQNVLSIQTAPGQHSTKNALIDTAPQLIDRLGTTNGPKTLIFVLDADAQKNGEGHTATLQRFTNKIKNSGYSSTANNTDKLHIFTHSHLPSLGLWIMPNNQNDGCLEDWIKSCISDEETPFLKEAQNATQSLITPRFQNATKAEIYTWLAWQKKPALNLHTVLDKTLLNPQAESYLEFTQAITDFVRQHIPT